MRECSVEKGLIRGSDFMRRSDSIGGGFRFSFTLAILVCLAPAVGQAHDWPEWLGPNREGIWRETGLLTRFPQGGPKVLWRTPLGAGYSGPAVVDGRVYVMDRERAMDKAGKPLPAGKEGIARNERLVCLDAANGKVLWQDVIECPYKKVGYPTGPRTTPLVRDGCVYTLGTMGDLRCLDSKTGKVRWAKNLMTDYKLEAPPVWGWAAHPLLEGNLLYCLVGGEGSAVVAFHKDTGKEVWRALTTEEIGYSPPVIHEGGGKRQLIVWLSEALTALDPDTGQLYWTLPYPGSVKPMRPSVNIVTARCQGNLVFVSNAYHGPFMVKLAADKPAASVFWKGKSDRMEKPDGLHCLIPTPVIKDGYIYGIGVFGELRCFEAATGKTLWQTYKATCGKKADFATAFLVPQGERFVVFNDLGDLILADINPQGYKEIDRAHILDPVQAARGRDIVWSHPAFAQRCVFARNDKEIVCASLAGS
jgi:outer membrane protein assembly factor BamB